MRYDQRLMHWPPSVFYSTMLPTVKRHEWKWTCRFESKQATSSCVTVCTEQWWDFELWFSITREKYDDMKLSNYFMTTQMDDEDDPWWHKEGWVSYMKLRWISVLSSFHLTFTFLFSVMCQIYIAKKIKIQGVPWCKNQSWYHISCHTTTQVMFVFLLFEHVTFIHKQNSAHSLPHPYSPSTPHFFISDAVSSPGPPILSNSICRHLRRLCYCHIVRLCAMCACARWNNLSTSMRAFVLSKRLQLYLPWLISVSVGRQPSIIPMDKN